MTRPRARPKPGRYWVVVNHSGLAIAAEDSRRDAELKCRYYGPTHRIVECVPMPRVRVGTVTISPGTSWFGVFVNGSRTSEAYKSRAAAAEHARDLRRALRGK